MRFKPLIFALLAVLIASSCSLRKPASVAKEGGQEGEFALTGMLIDAKRELFAGNVQKASDLLQKCIEKKPDYAVAWYELSLVQELQGDNKQALHSASQAHRHDQANNWYIRRYAQLCDREGNRKEALNLHRKLAAAEPNNFEHKLNIARLLELEGKYEGVIRELNDIERSTGLVEELSLEKRRIYMLWEKPDKAIAEIQALSRKYPEEIRYKGMLAELYEMTGQADKALSLLREMMVMQPNNGLVSLSLASHYTRAGEKEKAFAETLTAFASHDVSVDTKVGILLQYYEAGVSDTGFRQNAFQLIEIMEATHPEEAKTYAIKADFLLLDGRKKEAADCFMKVISVDSLRFPVWDNLLKITRETGDFDNLLELSTRAMELFPEQAGLYLYQGVALFEKRKFQEAIEPLLTGKYLSGRNNTLLFEFNMALGDVYKALGDKQKALSFYRMALQINPASEVLKSRINALE